MFPDLLGVVEHISALLRVYPRDSIQQTALEPQSDGSARLENGLACFLDVDFLDRLARYLSVCCSETYR